MHVRRLRWLPYPDSQSEVPPFEEVPSGEVRSGEVRSEVAQWVQVCTQEDLPPLPLSPQEGFPPFGALGETAGVVSP